MTLHPSRADSKNLTDTEITAAIEANMVGYYREIVSRWPQVAVHDEAHWLWTISDIPYRLFNFVLRPQFPVDEAEAFIDASIERCKAHGVATVWKLAPTALPVDLGDRLLAKGFTLQHDIPAMALDLTDWKVQPISTPGLVVQKVNDAETAAIWSRVLAEVYSFPAVVEGAFAELATVYSGAGDWPVHNYLAYLDNKAVACATVFLKDGTAGIYNVGTLEHARGKGVGQAITSAPLRAAQAEGCWLSSLQSTRIGFPLYQRIGYKPYFHYRYYGWSPQDQA